MASVERKPLLFLSFDIESDGPAPGLNSMLAMGWAGFDETGQLVFEYEAHLTPLPEAVPNDKTMSWWKLPENQTAWDYVQTDQRDPGEVCRECASHLERLAATYTLEPVAWPAAFDWQYINYYFNRFLGRNPLGYSAMCIEAYIWALTQKASSNDVHKSDLAAYKDPQYPHTHRALDDAKEQGVMFYRAWASNRSP
jgi:hypothetical protein